MLMGCGYNMVLEVFSMLNLMMLYIFNLYALFFMLFGLYSYQITHGNQFPWEYMEDYSIICWYLNIRNKFKKKNRSLLYFRI